MEKTESKVYDEIYQGIKAKFDVYNQPNKLSLTAKMAMISGGIKRLIKEFGFVGFYVVAPLYDDKGDPILTQDKILEIGPFLSEHLPTCKIGYGKGVCGTAWKEKKVQIVNNVKTCSNYIACDDETISEIVLPVFKSKDDKENVIAVLDIDSSIHARFEHDDEVGLQKILDLIYI